MTRDELNTKLNDFIEIERLDEKSKRTLVDYKNAINKLIDFLPEENININKNVMMDFKDYLTDKKFKVKSKNKYIVIVNKFIKYLGYNDSIIKKFKEQQKSSIDDPIWEQEHKRMLRWAKKMNNYEMYMIIQVLGSTGARVDELKYFTVESLNCNYIKGAYNKGKERTLIMTNEIKRELKHYCKDNKIKTGYIFRSPDPKRKYDPNLKINNSTVWRNLKKIARKAKINPDKIHPHAWRHLFAKKCKEKGIDLDELQDILGHNNIQTTALYTKTSNREKKEKLEKLWKN